MTQNPYSPDSSSMPDPTYGSPQPQSYPTAPPAGSSQGYNPPFQQEPPQAMPQGAPQAAPQAVPQGVPQPPYQPQPLPATDRKSKLATGLLAIFLGSFGVHNFYVGRVGLGVAQLLITLLSLGILSGIVWIWALIEGIMYLASDQPRWCTDGYGNPMVKN